MIVKLIDGKDVRINLKNKRLDTRLSSKSKFQQSIGKKLVKQYPHDIIYTEVKIPYYNIIIDFFIPSLRLVIEAHGQQHKKHIKHFHKTKQQFHKQLDRDSKLRQWCVVNNFRLIEIYND